MSNKKAKNVPQPKVGKERLDKLVYTLGLSDSREQAARMIMAGLVVVDDHRVDKAGKVVSINARIRIKDRLPFVSRGGYKLQHAVEVFRLDVAGKVCLDIGASTGGFTDVLLQHDARLVYAVDVGESLLHHSLVTHPRVRNIVKTNFRTIEFSTIGERVDIIVGDLSFISLRLIFPSMVQFVHDATVVVVLIKPQFEADRGTPMKHGILRDLAVHEGIIMQTLRFAASSGLSMVGLAPSPILGGKGNREYLCCLKVCRGGINIEGDADRCIQTIVSGVVHDDLCYNL